MFRTLGNSAANPNVGLLFIRFGPAPKRIRVNGRATLVGEPARVVAHHGAKALIEVACTDIFRNCPRYIPDLSADAVSAYVPRPGHTPPIPEWKTYPFVTPLLPRPIPTSTRLPCEATTRALKSGSSAARRAAGSQDHGARWPASLQRMVSRSWLSTTVRHRCARVFAGFGWCGAIGWARCGGG